MSDVLRTRRGRIVASILFLLAAAAVAVFFATREDEQNARLAACPAGYHRLEPRDENARKGLVGEAGPVPSAEPDHGGDNGEEGDQGEESAKQRPCILRQPETPGELLTLAHGIAARSGLDAPGTLAAATAAAAKIGPAPGGNGRWAPVGHGPLIADDPAYPQTAGEGFSKLAGRVSDFAYDTTHKRLYAAVASGGVYESTNTGGSWHSVGDTLPTQTVGSVGWTPAGGGTVIALTGDNAFGGYTFSGVGAFWSTNRGRVWHKARGVPNGAMGFKVAVDKAHPSTVYLATGLGLFRSTNAGRSFRNVRLPTGACAGNSAKAGCFLANVVTDVVVQAPDSFGHKGGAVLAAVGWRSGAFKNPDGSIQAPANGLYSSSTGQPGSFKRLDVDSDGFAPQANIGRVEMGVASGPKQDHGYVYAIVQDAKLFVSGKLEGLDAPNVPDPLGLGVNPTATPTYLNGVYVSKDFGATWTKMEGRQQFLLPSSGSALSQVVALGYGPGIQTWYDEWIQPDPTTAGVGGAPSRVVLGMEELYANRPGFPATGATDFQAVGPYNATGGACLLVLATPACNSAHEVTGATTTHPDQHAGIWVPDGKGGVTLVVGNDGGAYTQHVDAGGNVTQSGFGKGAQSGFHTLLPYGVAVSRDGVVYAGLQDNGEMRIQKNGTQNETYGGDGVFTVVDPKNSNVAWEETPEAGIDFTTDGGVNWTQAFPLLDNASFYSPVVMDPKSSQHIVTGGREVAELTVGTNYDSSASGIGTEDAADYTAGDRAWVRVFDLGTRLHPGDANATNADGYDPEKDPQNQVSAEDVRGANIYAGYCGGCDPVRDHDVFASGIATNVGGSKAPKSNTANGWHIAAAKGLPERIITSVRMDPANPRTVYATLGSSHLRPYAPPGATGRGEGTQRSGGFVYVSHDAGKTFKNITGNLPHVGATWADFHRNHLVVATTVGVFESQAPVRGAGAVARPVYGVVGKGLPAAPVFSFTFRPGSPDDMYVASLGRGIYRYHFTKPEGCLDHTPPVSRFASSSRVTRTGVTVSGTTRDSGCGARSRVAAQRGGVRAVRVSIARRQRGGCHFLLGREGGFGHFGPQRTCVRPPFPFAAKGHARWSFRLRVPLPPGVYQLYAKGTDLAGNSERYDRKRRNGTELRVR